MVSALDRLTSEAFMLSAGFLSTPAGVRRFLHRTRETREIREALRQGAIAEHTIERFVSSLLEDLHPGESFPHQLALSALAVVMETWPTEFAERFLLDLSRLRSAEMSLCIRVARECLKQRVSITQRTVRVFDLRRLDDEEIPFSVASSTSSCQEKAFRLTNATDMCEVI